MTKSYYISPVFKGKGKDRKEPGNYRPVSLISNPCKIFASILNSRMLDYLKENNLLVEEQNGFRKGRSCLDHIFVLPSVITAKLKEKKSVFACFIDFSSAYDFVNRDLLLYALRSIGIEGKMFGIIKAYYTGTQSAVKINQKMAEWFNTYAGVRQGQNDSSTLFIIFLNSLAVKLKSLNIGVNICKINVTLLLYADDIVILSLNEADIQSLLNKTEKSCYEWRMKMNPEKHKSYTLDQNGHQKLKKYLDWERLSCR